MPPACLNRRNLRGLALRYALTVPLLQHRKESLGVVLGPATPQKVAPVYVTGTRASLLESFRDLGPVSVCPGTLHACSLLRGRVPNDEHVGPVVYEVQRLKLASAFVVLAEWALRTASFV